VKNSHDQYRDSRQQDKALKELSMRTYCGPVASILVRLLKEYHSEVVDAHNDAEAKALVSPETTIEDPRNEMHAIESTIEDTYLPLVQPKIATFDPEEMPTEHYEDLSRRKSNDSTMSGIQVSLQSQIHTPNFPEVNTSEAVSTRKSTRASRQPKRYDDRDFPSDDDPENDLEEDDDFDQQKVASDGNALYSDELSGADSDVHSESENESECSANSEDSNFIDDDDLSAVEDGRADDSGTGVVPQTDTLLLMGHKRKYKKLRANAQEAWNHDRMLREILLEIPADQEYTVEDLKNPLILGRALRVLNCKRLGVTFDTTRISTHISYDHLSKAQRVALDNVWLPDPNDTEAAAIRQTLASVG
jgi:hypothetical protein